MIDPYKLFTYAVKFHSRNSEYPTLRACAKRFRVTQDEIEEATYDYDGTGYMQVTAGISNGVCWASVEGGDRLVEAYD